MRVITIGRHGPRVLPRAIFAISYVIATGLRVLLDRRELAGLIVTTNPPFVGVVALLMKRAFGTPYVKIVYDVYPDSAVKVGLIDQTSLVAGAWRRITAAICRRAAAVVVVGRDMTEVVDRLTDSAARITFIPNWSDENRVRPLPRVRNAFLRDNHLNDRIVVQYSGNMAVSHDIECLIGAAILLAGDSRVMFQFIGGGSRKRIIQEEARKAGLTNVQFLPLQPVENLAVVLSAASLGVVALGSRFAGLSVPSKTYGIMASGVPILALVPERSEIGRTVTESHCGVVLPEADPRRVAEVIRNLQEDPMRFAAMGRNGRTAFLKRYTLSRAAARYDDLLYAVFGNVAREPASQGAQLADLPPAAENQARWAALAGGSREHRSKPAVEIHYHSSSTDQPAERFDSP